MQLLVTAEEMREFDRKAIEHFSIPGLVLMENAGRAFVDRLETHVHSFKDKRVLVICGKGNNGGDGFVIARHLANRGATVSVAILCKQSQISGDARTNLQAILKLAAAKQSGISFKQISSSAALSKIPFADIIVDAIFGTGFSGNVVALPLKAIEWINRRRVFVAAVDIPSGVDASTGIVGNIAVMANMTITMGLGKIGHYVGEGREHSGTVEVVDIGLPDVVLHPDKQATYRVRAEDIVLPRRKLTDHKYTVGKVLIIGGSRTFTGAPVLTAMAAMKSGSGAAVLGVPKSIQNILSRKLTEVMLLPLEETMDGSVARKALSSIQQKAAWADVVAIGPGLSRNPETLQSVRELVSKIKRPLVIDADALVAIGIHASILKRRKHPTILTPHVGELAQMTGLHGEEIEEHRVRIAKESVKRFRSIVVLKGSPTVVATVTGTAYINSTGNPGMATAGSGDVLTGIIASFIGQGMNPEQAAFSGVYVHGLAGDLAGKRHGQRSIMALDILNMIPRALQSLER